MNRNLCVVALAGLLLGGCVVAPAPGYREPILYEPPPPRVEYPGYAPVAGYIWFGGYWTWTGHRHEWVPGRWDAPRPGYRWIAPRWERDGNRWRQYEGRWEPHEGGVRVMPAPAPMPRQERFEERRPEPAPAYRQDRDWRDDSRPAYRQERGMGPTPAPVPQRGPGNPAQPQFDTRGPAPSAGQPSGPRYDPGDRGRGGEMRREERRDERRDDRRDDRRSGRRGQDDNR